MSPNTRTKCLQCGAKVGKPCFDKETGDIIGLVHAARLGRLTLKSNMRLIDCEQAA